MNTDVILPQSSSPHVSITVALPGQHFEFPEVVQFFECTLVPPPQVWEQGLKDQADQPPSPVGEERKTTVIRIRQSKNETNNVYS